MDAGFWKRFLAILIDICGLWLARLLIRVFKITLGLFGMEQDLTYWASGEDGAVFSVLLITASVILLPWLYYAILESSKLQGTIGKKVMGIIVVDQHNRPVSFWRASGRYWGKLLSSVFFVGFIITGLTQRKQALHDLIAQTYVVNRKALEQMELHPGSYVYGLPPEWRPPGNLDWPVLNERALIYAGFWKRFFANILDVFIMYILFLVFAFLGFMLDMLIGIGRALILWDSRLFEIIYMSVRLVSQASVPWLYYAILESSKLQGTFGKKALGIIVVDQYYERVSFGRASGRFWSRILSFLTIYVGYIMAAFTKKKQALHDLIAQTYVVNKAGLQLSGYYPPVHPQEVYTEGQQV